MASALFKQTRSCLNLRQEAKLTQPFYFQLKSFELLGGEEGIELGCTLPPFRPGQPCFKYWTRVNLAGLKMNEGARVNGSPRSRKSKVKI